MSSTNVGRKWLWLLVATVIMFGAGCKHKKVNTPPPDQQSEQETVKLGIHSVVPEEARSSDPVQIGIKGTAFKAGAQVVLGDNLLPSVSVDSSSYIRATVPAGLAAGSYDVSVRNPDGTQATKRNAFTVLPPEVKAPPPETCTLEMVHFAYDSSSLSDEAREILRRDVECLNKRNARRVQVAGHTDERGSTEYNLALGQRRAEETRRYLQRLGISSVSAISYGEEQPLVRRSDESAWAQNRRAEIIILE